jgi:hypothetical protein
MPCRTDDDPGRDYSYELRQQNEMLKASLCAVLTTLENYGFNIFLPNDNTVNWKEAGVSMKELKTWWEVHKEIDKQRREREAAELKAKEEKQRIAKRREEILSKLTPEERKILGVK